MNQTLQSVLAPHGPQAGQIATLAWILFLLAAVVLAVVIAATWLPSTPATMWPSCCTT